MRKQFIPILLSCCSTFVVILSLVIVISIVPTVIVLAADGDLDAAFGDNGKVITDFGHEEDVSSLLIQNDGKIVAVGSAISGEGFILARYDINGNLDSGFGVAGKVVTNFYSPQSANSAVLQPDGKIIVGGTAFKVNHFVFALARYNVDGSLDHSFGSSGIVDADLFTSDQISAITLHQDGKIVAVGNSFSNGILGVVVARYNNNGSLDSSFGTGGKVLVETTLSGFGSGVVCAFQPDHKIILGGIRPPLTEDFVLMRLSAGGSIDTTFGTNGSVITDFSNSIDALTALALQPDGKIVAAGWSSISQGSTHSALARYTSDGSLDQSFGTGGKIVSTLQPSFDQLRAVTIQSDGKIVVAGQGISRLLVARYQPTGTLDQAFGVSGVTTAVVGDLGGEARNLAVQSDGKILAAGLVFNFNTGLDFVLVRLQGGTFDLCIQDENNGNLLQVNVTTGAYQLKNCSGLIVGGTGSIVRKGCYLTLQANGTDRRVLARIDSCANTASATIQLLSQGTIYSIVDRNTTNNTCSCANSF